MKKNELLKIILSFFILFHLLAVGIYPNPNSVLTQSLSPLIRNYGNQLGLNTTWQFFSPNPGSIRYLEYDVIVENEEDIKIDKYSFPPQEDSSLWKANQGRLFYYSIRMISDTNNIANFLIPYLCRKHPEATSVALKAIDKRIPSMAKARYQGATGFSELQQQVDVPEQELGCERKGAE